MARARAGARARRSRREGPSQRQGQLAQARKARKANRLLQTLLRAGFLKQARYRQGMRVKVRDMRGLESRVSCHQESHNHHRDRVPGLKHRKHSKVIRLRLS